MVDRQNPEMGVISMTWQNIAITVGTAAVLLAAGYWVLQKIVLSLVGREALPDTASSEPSHGDGTQPPVLG